MSSDIPISIVGCVCVKAQGPAGELGSTAGARNEAVVHHIPAKIGYDGPAKVNAYFCPEKSDATGNELEAYFRGRRFKGHELRFPAGVTGIIVREISGTRVSNTGSSMNPEAAAAALPGSGVSSSRGSTTATSLPRAGSKPAAASSKTAVRDSGKTGYGSGAVSFSGAVGGYGKKAVVESSSDEEGCGDDDDDVDVGFAVDSEDSEEDDDDIVARAGGSGSGAEDGLTTPHKAELRLGGGGVSGSSASLADIPMRQWEIESAFTSATYWLHDKPISECDVVRAAVDWLDIARAVHGGDAEAAIAT